MNQKHPTPLDQNLRPSPTEAARTKVYILGAGCSVCGNYPQAKEVQSKLADFDRDFLDGDHCEKLRKCVTATCELLRTHKVETVDALAKALRGRDAEALEQAKIAMSAFFFALEEKAAEQAFPNYADFFDELFRYGDSPLPSLKDRMTKTPCRVVTFNYDRLFERTFVEWAKREGEDDEDSKQPERLLNSGFGDPIEIRDGRFSLLKLHGGIGQFNRPGGKRHYSQSSHLYWPPLDEKLPALADDPFFQRKGYETNRSTIAFPIEKQHQESIDVDGGHPFHNYLHIVWKKAREFCRQAREIHVLGYSIQNLDYFWFKSLMREVGPSAKVLIHNQAPHDKRLLRIMRGIADEFGAKWDIDFVAGDFYNRESKPV